MLRSQALRLLFLAGLGAACGDRELGRWTLSEVKASVNAESHVVVDVTYINDSDAEWGGSRCILIEWQRGTILTQDEARVGTASAAEVVENQRWCNGGSNALKPRQSDRFQGISAGTQNELAGTTIVVVAEEFKGTSGDDRRIVPSP